MSKAKDDYSLNDIESAYLAYAWIGQNIEYDNFGDNHGNSTNGVANIYKEGKGGAIWITGLFNTICNLLNIEINTIVGKTKLRTFNNTQYIKIKEYAWNYVLIDNKYYLIDAIMGSCDFVENNIYKNQRDFYFGLDQKYLFVYIFQMKINGNYYLMLLPKKNLYLWLIYLMAFLN